MNAEPPREAARLPRATELAHRWHAARLRPGDTAVDATAGNGHDTVFLARAVGPAGRVYGFDTQGEAIGATARRLAAEGLADRVTLILGCHSQLAGTIGPGAAVRSILFNLGYRPGGDKARVTRPETTLPALDAALGVLAPGGLLTAVAYPGHPGGAEETAAVAAWAAGLDPGAFSAAEYRFLNQANHPPLLFAVERR